MKLIGVELINFACFETCFVPLRQGMQVLVGKNNAGKTAILRGLSALAALPFSQPQPLDPDLAKYSRNTTGAPQYSFSVCFEVEPTDFPTLGGDLLSWPIITQSKKRELAFSFDVFPTQNLVGLTGANFFSDTNQFPILDRRADRMRQLFYNSAGEQTSSGEVTELSSRAVENVRYPTYAPQGTLSVFASIRSVRTADAHRVVRPLLGLQAVASLSKNAESLAPFLDTLYGNSRRKFQGIEQFVTRVFPEFESVNPVKHENNISLTLTRTGSDQTVPLTHCGTGVEQLLALASFVLTADPGTIILLDEPHSYLHPSAERELIRFLQEQSEHRYVISTHSSVLVNSVPPDRVVPLSGPVVPRRASADSIEIASLLHSLGYRNSDLLFSDRLIFVEGESDQEILPVLLSKGETFSDVDLGRTGFPTMDGEGRSRGTTKQTSLLYYERFLQQLGKSSLPRLYLFDGDCEDADRTLLRGTPGLEQSGVISLAFLSMRELENFLLVPAAIACAIRQLHRLANEAHREVDELAVRAKLEESLASADEKLFPNGRGVDPARTVKGSFVLERLFWDFGLRYRKRTAGRLIAEHITIKDQPRISEICDLVRGVFPTDGPRPRLG